MKNMALNIEQMLHLQNLGLDCSGASMSWMVYKDTADEWVEEKLPSRSHFKHDEESAPIICLKLGYSKGALYSAMSDCSNYSCCEVIPTFCLQDILSILPINIGWNSLYISKGDEWDISYESRNTTTDTITLIEFSSDILLEASYQLLCWCIDNNYIKTK